MVQNSQTSLLVIDPSCQVIHGHHYNSLRDLSAALAPRAISFIVHSAMPSDADFGSNARVTRAFTSTVYDEPGLGPRPNGRLARRLWKLKRVLNAGITGTDRAWTYASARISAERSLRAENWEFAAWSRKWPELKSALTQAVTSPVAHIIAPSSDVELICGLAQLRRDLPQLRNAHIHARLISLAPTLGRLRTLSTSTPAFTQLMADRLSNVHLYVETPAMQSLLAQASGLPSTIYPYLLAPPPLVARTETNPVRFGYFGGMRNEKGFQRLLPIIKMTVDIQSAKDPELAFTIHGGDATGIEAAELRTAFAAIATARATIEFIAGPLSETAYHEKFSAIDGALLPYTGARYASSGSGIVCEALALGKVILLSKGLSFGGQCNFSHSIEAGDDREFAEAILTVARNLPRYRHAANQRAIRYVDDVRTCTLLQRLKAK